MDMLTEIMCKKDSNTGQTTKYWGTATVIRETEWIVYRRTGFFRNLINEPYTEMVQVIELLLLNDVGGTSHFGRPCLWDAAH